jgi:predicted Rossmann fold nucleotide-binding protein DprA/Smf involved in DNA uptake
VNITAIRITTSTSPEYPASLQQFLGDNAPESFTTSGNFELLSHRKLAIFSSSTCPASLLPEFDRTFGGVSDPQTAVISGFHSEAEKHCLNILLDCHQPVIIAPARSLDRMRVRLEYKEPLENGRLLFASFFKTHRHRSEIDLAIRRNRYVAALADRILIVHAPAESKTEQLCRELISWGKPVYTLESEANHNLFKLGVKPITAR